MSNNTSPPVSHLEWSVLYTVYIAEGSLISIGNLLIVSAVARYEALRHNKEYVFMAALSLADSCHMLGFFFAGIDRMRLLHSGLHHSISTAGQCLGTVHIMFWSFSSTLSTMMLCVISADRLLCVWRPLTYLGLTVTYARRFVGAVYIVNLLGAAYIYVSGYGSAAPLSALCVPPSVVFATTHRLYFLYFMNAPQLFGAVSVMVYVFVILLYKRMSNAVSVLDNSAQKYEMKRQRKVTVTLSLSAMGTFFLFVIPFSIAMNIYNKGYYGLALGLWCVANLNPLLNAFLYPLMHSEMRRAIRAMFSCKSMPVDLRMWTVHLPPNVERVPSHSQQLQLRYVPRQARVIDERV